jgi:putative transposase
VAHFTNRLGIARGKFFEWKKRYGKVNEHNGKIPRDHWLLDWEREAILKFFIDHPFDGYRRLAFMMIDQDIVAASPSSVYRVLSRAGFLSRGSSKATKKGQGFKQPIEAHQHWHIDISYLNIAGTFYYLCSILDGFSRFIVHWEIRERMKEVDVETIVQRAKEKYLDATPRVISDNGPQFVAKDFKEFIRLAGMTHVRTSPYYPQSNGKKEAWYKTLKSEVIRPKCPGTVDEARQMVSSFVAYYNEERLHSAIGYVSPNDKLEGRAEEIQKERDRKLEESRAKRAARRAAMRMAS